MTIDEDSNLNLSGVLKAAQAARPDEGLLIPKEGHLETITDTKYCPRFPRVFKIKAIALQKAQTYAKLVNEVLGETLECYGFLLERTGNYDGVIEDCMLAPDQEVSFGSAELSHDAVQKAGEMVAADFKGYNVNGWWHSHGSMGTFHSYTDNRNIETVLDHTVAYQVVNGLDIKSFAAAAAPPLSAPDAPKIKAKYAYSLVVNVDNSHHGEIALQHACGSVVKKPLPFQIIGENVAESGFDIKEMRAFVKENVKRKKWGWQPGGIYIWKDGQYVLADNGKEEKPAKGPGLGSGVGENPQTRS